MDSSLPGRLTENLIRSVFQRPGQKLKGIVQCLSFVEQTMKEKKLYSVKLSDGFFWSSFLLYPNINEIFVAQVKPNDILEVGLLKRDMNSQFMLIYEFNILYSPVTEEIGAAVEYVPGAENPKGDNEIPQKVLEDHLANESKKVDGEDTLFPPLEHGDKGQFVELETDGVKEKVRKEPVNRLMGQREKGGFGETYIEIANLNMYDRSWTIKGRIIRKTEMRKFKGSNKEGSVFSVVIKDESRTIQATFFNDAAEKFYDFLKEGKVYSFSDGQMRPSSRFNLTDNKYEVTFSENSVIKEIANDPKISTVHFNLCTIEGVKKRNEHSTLDLLAIVDEIEPTKEINMKEGGMVTKRSVWFVDHTNHRIEVTFWRDIASDFSFPVDTILLITDCKVKDFRGRSLSSSNTTKILNNVKDLPELKALTLFRNSRKPGKDNYISLSESSPKNQYQFFKISKMKEEVKKLQDAGENARMIFSLVGYFLRTFSDPFYSACPNDNCMKKLVFNNGSYYCEKCHKSFSDPKIRFWGTFRFADDSGIISITLSGEEVCQALLGCSPDKLRDIRNSSEAEFTSFVREKMFGEFNIVLVAKKDFFNQELRIKYHAFKIVPVASSTQQFADSFLTILENPV